MTQISANNMLHRASNPELGPKMLFFSGGTALSGMCSILKGYTHNSVHLVTPFDSGGSSAELRSAFAMPAIGDLRSRITSLADESMGEHDSLHQLFSYRFPANSSPRALHQRLIAICSGTEELTIGLSTEMKMFVEKQLTSLLKAMPSDFNLTGANIGNLILAGLYLNYDGDLQTAVRQLSEQLQSKGIVRATVNDNYHLAACLKNGNVVVGQHNITGKEVAPLTVPIERVFLSSNSQRAEPVEAYLDEQNRQHILASDLICYPPGSFYSSLLANILPQGVGECVAQSSCPKVFIPNLGNDPEQLGMTLQQSIQQLLGTLKAHLVNEVSTSQLLNYVLLDANTEYPGGVPTAWLKQQQIQPVALNLVNQQGDACYQAAPLVNALLGLVSKSI